jgi:hypothetical protein
MHCQGFRIGLDVANQITARVTVAEAGTRAGESKEEEHQHRHEAPQSDFLSDRAAT